MTVGSNPLTDTSDPGAGDMGEVSRLASVLSTPSHASSIEEVTEFLRVHYGVEGTLLKLGSERDENYRLTSADGSQRLLKLSHALEDPALIDFQSQALLHIAARAPALPIQRLIPALSGAIEIQALGSDGRSRRGRLFTFLAGAPLSGFAPSAAQASSLGVLAAGLDRALEDFRHPASDHVFLWDIQHAVRTRSLLEYSPPSIARDLCEMSIDRFERNLGRDLTGFRRQVIHNDLNPHNLLVYPSAPAELAGIIDFGDMVSAPLVNEVAVASAYLLTANAAPLGTVPHLLAAYHSIFPLEPHEIEALPQLIALRHAITLLITNWRAAKYPENRDYILRNQPHAVAGLQKLSALPERTVQRLLLEACKSVKP